MWHRYVHVYVGEALFTVVRMQNFRRDNDEIPCAVAERHILKLKLTLSAGAVNKLPIIMVVLFCCECYKVSADIYDTVHGFTSCRMSYSFT